MQYFLSRIVRQFPREGLSSAFGYGSAVLPQSGQFEMMSSKMLDMIFVVDCPTSWHALNLKKHPDHYWWFSRLCGSSYMNFLHNHVPKHGVYFNTLVPFQSEGIDRLIKYGVISRESFIKDLTCWNRLYVSGRLHKPVEWVIQEGAIVAQLQRKNIEAALSAALLLLPETFSTLQLFCAITELSYKGDSRMSFFENRRKVENIVEGQMQRFRLLYGPLLYDMPQVDYRSAFGDLLQRDVSLAAQQELASRLPPKFLLSMLSVSDKKRLKDAPTEELCQHFVEHYDVEERLKKALYMINRRTSIMQSVKGVLSAGPGKALLYGVKKFMKNMDSRV